jgi:hypothetical protein
MEIRKDMYPEPEDQKGLQALAFRTQEAFSTTFPTVEDVINYANKFKNPKITKLFLDIGNYYHSAKFYSCPNCTPPERSETCPHCNSKLEMPAFIMLIMSVSIMEKLASVDSNGVESWVDFYDWVNRKDITAEYTQALRKGKFREYKAMMDSLKARWSVEFGGLTKVTSFLAAIMSSEEKRVLVKSIRYLQEVPELPQEGRKSTEFDTEYEDSEKRVQTRVEEKQKVTFGKPEDVKQYVKQQGSKTTWEALPVCYDESKYWNCYAVDFYGHGVGYCRLKHDCTLLTDEKKLDKCFKATVKTIHDWRSKFVHDTQLPPLKGNVSFETNYGNRRIIVEIATTELKTIFEQLIKRFFDKLQKSQKK